MHIQIDIVEEGIAEISVPVGDTTVVHRAHASELALISAIDERTWRKGGLAVLNVHTADAILQLVNRGLVFDGREHDSGEDTYEVGAALNRACTASCPAALAILTRPRASARNTLGAFGVVVTAIGHTIVTTLRQAARAAQAAQRAPVGEA